MSGRSTRSPLSTSISRRPFAAYLTSIALTSDDLPVPREPVSSTLFAGKPATNWRVFASIDALLLVDRRPGRRGGSRADAATACRDTRARRACASETRAHASSRDRGGGARQQRLDALEHRLGARERARQRFAFWLAQLSAAVVGVDADVFVREIAGPHGRRARCRGRVRRARRSRPASSRAGRPPRGSDAARPPSSTTSTSSSQNDTRAGSRSLRRRIADRADDASEVRIRREERRLDQRRMGDRARDAIGIRRRRVRLRRAIAMNLVAPSPSRTIAWASSMRDDRRARRAPPAVADRRRVRDRRDRGLRRSAISTKLSLVDVSPSMVTRLNDASAISRASSRSSARTIGASVATKPSIVAMFGAIMPAPLAMPVTVIGRRRRRRVATPPFGTVSVVMIARAAANQPSSRAAPRAARQRTPRSCPPAAAP